MRKVWPRRARTALAALLFLGMAAACGGGGGGGGTTGAGAPLPAPPGSPPPPTGPSFASVIPGPRPMAAPREFVTFESGQVRPLALSADGQSLFVVNTPDNRLEVFALDNGDATDQPSGTLATQQSESLGITDADPLHQVSVPVGMEPVAVAVGPDETVWVVNHLSDSISIIAMDMDPPRVVRTLQVGDEPRDIVVAGADFDRVFVTTARRGQNSPIDPALDQPGISRANVWVFDAPAVIRDGETTPITILQPFGDTPRALAVTPDGSRVYAAVFRSGNGTTSIAPANFSKAPPTRSSDGVRQPDSGLILKLVDGSWVDDLGQTYDQFVPFALPDLDVFEFDALADPPRQTDTFRGVGTTLFNMAVNPADGSVYVSNMEARNHVRFAGRPTRGSTTVRGHLADHRVTVLADGEVKPRVLNKHIDFDREVGTADERNRSLSQPMDMAVSADGKRLYVAAFGSGKIGVFDTAELENDSFEPDADRQIELSAGGPGGLVLDERRDRAYVLTRFDNGLSVIDLTSQTEIAHQQLFNPEPDSVVDGRPLLYDARITSSNGNDSCATCHLFGDSDGLAWDLGDPNGTVQPITNAFIPISAPADPATFHPMKGPMATQSMRGLMGHGPMHWRGDRSGQTRMNGETLEEAAFKEFNEAFDSLMGRDGEISTGEMQAFTDFAMQLTYPPNPIRALDNDLDSLEQRGLDLYRSGIVRIQTGLLEVCIQCHPINPPLLQFGTGGLMSDNTQAGERNVKIPHFRDFYQKVGMFGWAFNAPPETGRQVRAFGYNHNGATSGNFVTADLGMPQEDLDAIRAFLFAFPTESAPILGQQVTLRHDNAEVVGERIDLLLQRGSLNLGIPECELIVKGVVNGDPAGWLMGTDGVFRPDRAGPDASLDDLKAIASQPGQSLTFTCAPWGSGERMGIDRDLDGVPDGEDPTTG